jgi:hypothetical protein
MRMLKAKGALGQHREAQRRAQYLAAAFAMRAIEGENASQVSILSQRAQSDSRSSTQQCGASAPADSSLSTMPVTGFGRNVVQPFKPMS